VLISGYPSTGKTSLAMNIAEHVVTQENKPVGVFSLEMSAEQLMLRMTASQARVNLRTFTSGHASPLEQVM
jgi:replicative DNA helicase